MDKKDNYRKKLPDNQKRAKNSLYPGNYEHRIQKNFGTHPDFIADQKKYMDLAIRNKQIDCYFGKKIRLRELHNILHPAIYLIPRNKYINLRYNDGDAVGIEQLRFPFSSYDFYVNEEIDGVFKELYYCQEFLRLNRVNQLAYLVLPDTDQRFKDKIIHYMVPMFPHSRYIHSLIVGILADVILARAGFSIEERAPIVLGFTCHDIGTPAGGDSIKRIDMEHLDEESNFRWIMARGGLKKKWKDKFNFDVEEAAGWIRGEGWLGKLLNAIDRISYVALDCFYIGYQRRGNIRSLCLKNPLVMDVWQDIRIAPDRESFYFTDPEKLYDFLLLRAYEHTEFLLNPYSRALDFFLTKKVKKLYESGFITKEELLSKGDQWLFNVLEVYYPDEFKGYISPDALKWRKFRQEKDCQRFLKKIEPLADHTEHLKGFKTGLNWPTLFNGRIVELKDAIDPDKARKLESLSESTAGYYVYYLNENAREIGD